MSKFPPRTLIVVTYDEDDYNYHNRVYTVLVGSTIPAGSSDTTHYTHYSLLKTVEENWNLGSLGRNDAHSNHFDL